MEQNINENKKAIPTINYIEYYKYQIGILSYYLLLTFDSIYSVLEQCESMLKEVLKQKEKLKNEILKKNNQINNLNDELFNLKNDSVNLINENNNLKILFNKYEKMNLNNKTENISIKNEIEYNKNKLSNL